MQCWSWRATMQRPSWWPWEGKFLGIICFKNIYEVLDINLTWCLHCLIFFVFDFLKSCQLISWAEESSCLPLSLYFYSWYAIDIEGRRSILSFELFLQHLNWLVSHHDLYLIHFIHLLLYENVLNVHILYWLNCIFAIIYASLLVRQS